MYRAHKTEERTLDDRIESVRKESNGVASPFRNPWLLSVLVVLTVNHCIQQQKATTDQLMSTF